VRPSAWGLKAIKCGSVVAAGCLAAFATGASFGHSQTACGSVGQQVELYKTLFCIPKSAGYEIRAVDQDRIRFEEVHWVEGNRASVDEFKTHRRLNKDGNDVSVAVLTTITTGSRGASGELERAVLAAVTARQPEFLRMSVVSFEISSWCGRQAFEFKPHSDGTFTAAVESESTLFCREREYWIVGTSYSSVDVLLRCSQARDSEFACGGGFDVGNAHAFVSAFGKSVSHLTAAYRENRSVVLSFVSK
jgi:hypothetical protein